MQGLLRQRGKQLLGSAALRGNRAAVQRRWLRRSLSPPPCSTLLPRASPPLPQSAPAAAAAAAAGTPVIARETLLALRGLPGPLQEQGRLQWQRQQQCSSSSVKLMGSQSLAPRSGRRLRALLPPPLPPSLLLAGPLPRAPPPLSCPFPFFGPAMWLRTCPCPWGTLSPAALALSPPQYPASLSAFASAPPLPTPQRCAARAAHRPFALAWWRRRGG